MGLPQRRNVPIQLQHIWQTGTDVLEREPLIGVNHLPSILRGGAERERRGVSVREGAHKRPGSRRACHKVEVATNCHALGCHAGLCRLKAERLGLLAATADQQKAANNRTDDDRQVRKRERRARSHRGEV